jgi:hypothetical protein
MSSYAKEQGRLKGQDHINGTECFGSRANIGGISIVECSKSIYHFTWQNLVTVSATEIKTFTHYIKDVTDNSH